MKVIIPLIKSKWSEEIRFSLRSWDKFYSDKMELILIGDFKPDWFKGNHIHIQQSKKKTTEENLANIWWFILNECDDFIWTNDDIYLMKEISFSELEKPLYLQDLNQVKIRNMNRWGRLLWRTTDKLKEKDLTIFNGECHTPYYYQNHLIKKIFYDYEIHIGKGLLRTAYINNFYDKDELVPMGNKKCGFYSPSNIKINESSIYLNHDDFGLTSSLKSKIEELFPWKSRWER